MIIELHTDSDYTGIIRVWEKSVRASHHFLSESDIDEIRSKMPTHYLPNVTLYVVRDKNDAIAGFIGLSGDMIEMLFIAPECQGSGIGASLIEFALGKGIDKVDVNEQNVRAFEFYRKHGFDMIGRDALDSMGRPFPILHLKHYGLKQL